MVLPLGDLAKTRIVPFGTYVLIALNVVIFLSQLEHGTSFTTTYAATPYEISHNIDLPVFNDPVPPFDPNREEPRRQVEGQERVPFPIWLTIFTSMFLHASPLHLAGNMLYLWIFGDNVEEVLGTIRYLIVYLACGFVGTVLQIAMNQDSLIPTLGASGAIAGIMGMYVVWFPQNQVRVLVFRFITQMPALYVIGFWIVLQIIEGVGSAGKIGETGGVAYLAHIGGAATGILFAIHYANRARAVEAAHDAQDGWFVGP
ncbi:rhomboid family intramembrane serine protease [Singulisphaera acidiphila]|uniref:Putative membrane protein n=1 Tax=Singulisphaera acidiphila (strain ATCC BAA-1392 / DSM 18658 / VKM B-2454 / MOB10) TaxID=886293 RepID=L0D8H8_SINAD|nr:rhomboid family intramembrane serine protease [Singulisphaera acidiphila]AGA25714.1 putative membrane protein [Singulisphaera acidiphila DSM 18658]